MYTTFFYSTIAVIFFQINFSNAAAESSELNLTNEDCKLVDSIRNSLNILFNRPKTNLKNRKTKENINSLNLILKKSNSHIEGVVAQILLKLVVKKKNLFVFSPETNEESFTFFEIINNEILKLGKTSIPFISNMIDLNVFKQPEGRTLKAYNNIVCNYKKARISNFSKHHVRDLHGKDLENFGITLDFFKKQ